MKLSFPLPSLVRGWHKFLALGALALALPATLAAQTLSLEAQKTAEAEAQKVIDTFTQGKMTVKLECSLSKQKGGQDSYAYSMNGGVLTVKGSSGVALCRGFYDFVKSQKAGISSWSGSRFVKPSVSSVPEVKVTSPYRDHQYLNVVTYGYTMPYWDKARWDKEIDWMALHGVDMPLVLIGQEAVYRMVFKDMGLTDAEIDEWEVGPAHLPWMRMGNLAGNTFDGPLGKEWNEGQIELGKYVIDRLRRLGMKPIFLPLVVSCRAPSPNAMADKPRQRAGTGCPKPCATIASAPTALLLSKWDASLSKSGTAFSELDATT